MNDHAVLHINVQRHGLRYVSAINTRKVGYPCALQRFDTVRLGGRAGQPSHLYKPVMQITKVRFYGETKIRPRTKAGAPVGDPGA